MPADPFESHTLSLILAWLMCVPMLLAGGANAISMLVGLPASSSRLLFYWVVLCAVVLSPVRYLLFVAVTAISFPVQSLSAFLTFLAASLYTPFVFGILFGLSVLMPAAAVMKIAGEDSSLIRRLTAGVLAPACFALGTYLFALILPLGAWTIGWFHPRDVIRATNGPAYYVFRYVAMYGSPMQFAVPTDALPDSPRDVMRLHVAGTYMTRGKEAWVLRTGYPDLYTRFYR